MNQKISIKNEGLSLQGRFEEVYKCEKINDFFQLPYEKQLIEYFNKKYIQNHLNTTVRYENLDRFASLERIEYYVMFSGKAFFLKQKNAGKFLYDKEKKKILYNNYARAQLLTDLCLFPQFDWLKNEEKQNKIHYTVLSSAVIRDILIGKLTNCEDIVKQYIKSLHVKNVNWKTYIKYLDSSYSNFNLKWLDLATTDINAAMEYYSNCDYEKKRQLKDMINQALSLNKKINPRWSNKRIEEEHLKMTQELMQAEINEKENTPVYSNCPQFEYPCKILNTEQEVFQEGKEMHHCIYTNYWNRIKENRYLGISFTYPERFTLGLKATDKGFVYDQAYLKYNNELSQESKQMIDKFLGDFNVIDLLRNLECNHEKVEIPTNEEDMEVVDEDVEWLNSILN